MFWLIKQVFIAGLLELKPRFYLLLYGPDSMTFYDDFMTF